MVQEFDDRQVCHDFGECAYFVELWSWDRADGPIEQGLSCATYLLSDCDVQGALSWAVENRSEHGSFVLHAAVSTSRGYLATARLAGHPPKSVPVESTSVRLGG